MRYVGLDVHKRTVRFCILDAAGKTLSAGDLACTRADLTAFGRTQLKPDDRLALEATTNTWAVVDVLRPWVAQVVVSNPLRTKAIAQAKVKTDKVDAQVLAQLLRCDYLPSVWQPDASTARLRQLTTLRSALVSDRTRLKNRVRSVLAGRLIEPPMSWLFGEAGLAWLAEQDLPPEERGVVDAQLRLLESVERELEGVDRQLKQLAYQNDKAKLLMTRPGVSHGTALALLAALGDISRFRDGDHAASYLGLVPSTRQSAHRCYHGPITKAGNSHARWMLTQGVQHLATHPGPLGVCFRRLCQRKNRNVAITAAARKLVTIAYLMLKHNEPYRYAVPKATQDKLARVRFASTGVRRKPTGVKSPKTPSGQRIRCARSLSEIYRDEGLPPATPVDRLPAGERRALVRAKVTAFARAVQRPSGS